MVRSDRDQTRHALRARRAAAQLDDELRFHVERQIAENIAAGMTRKKPATRHCAPSATPRWCATGPRHLELDVAGVAPPRCPLQSAHLSRTPGFAAIAILIMALGIGANVALFTVLRSMLLKPCPIVTRTGWCAVRSRGGRITHSTNSFFPLMRAASRWQHATQGMAEMAMVSPWQNYNLSAEGGKLPKKLMPRGAPGISFRCWACSLRWAARSPPLTTGPRPRLLSCSMVIPVDTSLQRQTPASWVRRSAGCYSLHRHRCAPRILYLQQQHGRQHEQVWTPVRHEAPPWLLATYADHEFLVGRDSNPAPAYPGFSTGLKAMQKQIFAAHANPSIQRRGQGRCWTM